MSEHQLDLFSFADVKTAVPPPTGRDVPVVAADRLDDRALIEAIPGASLAAVAALTGEAARRRLGAAVPVLATLCRRFAGFGTGHIVPEQAAALAALAAIGGREAALVVTGLIQRAVVQGPALRIALSAAVRLDASLSIETLGSFMAHPDPLIRADACRCARPLPAFVAPLLALLRDPHRTVAIAAACALARLGRSEALATLKESLRTSPSGETIDAVVTIADEECMVLLGRIARSTERLASKVLVALDGMDQPRADKIAAALRRDFAAAAPGALS